MACECDLLIIGGGPAGLSAAINGASEGLNVRLLDAGHTLGGQARESSAIENYPGFPEGVTGNDLMSRFVRQADRFKTSILCPLQAAHLQIDGDHKIITTEDYSEYTAKSVIISIGLSYRRLSASGTGPLMGRGIWYGMPPGRFMPTKACQIAVIGGANSAGQAVLKLASNPKINIKMIIRKTLESQMSTYLIDRIRAAPNVEVCEGCEVRSAHGRIDLESITVRYGDQTEKTLSITHMFIFIGAVPKTLWLKSALQLDEHRFIKTWKDVELSIADQMYHDKIVMPYETSLQGVFAAGDVRKGSTKRIATAIGEGAGALQMVHNYLGQLDA